jgi:hypothetical protein
MAVEVKTNKHCKKKNTEMAFGDSSQYLGRQSKATAQRTGPASWDMGEGKQE